MKYAVLIELSRSKIAFRYYRDDAGIFFLPFDDANESLPLAIYCQGNDLQIGQYAVMQAEKHDPCAWTNIFDVVKQKGNFVYRGQTMGMNELLLVAVKKYLDDFFDRILVRAQGGLEANISSMPLIFLLHSDIEISDRLFVRKSFFDGGFVNIAVLDFGSEIVKRLSADHKLDGKKYALTVFAEGSNLYVDAIDVRKKEIIRTLPLQGKGVDPRIGCAVDLMWQSLGYQSYSLVRENEENILRRVATAFLQSPRLEFNDSVVFSDGVERMVYLRRSQLDGMQVGIDVAIRGSIQNLMSQLNIVEQDCAIIPCGALSSSEYFMTNLRNVGPEVIVDSDNGFQKTLTSILNGAIACDFQFGKTASAIPANHPLSDAVKSKVIRTLREAALMTPQNAQVELMKIEQELMAITPPPTDLKLYLDKVNQAKERLKQRLSPQPFGGAVHGQNSSKPKAKTPLPQPDVRRLENILRIASRIVPENAIPQLQQEKDRLLQKVGYDIQEWVVKLDRALHEAENRRNQEKARTQQSHMPPPLPGRDRAARVVRSVTPQVTRPTRRAPQPPKQKSELSFAEARKLFATAISDSYKSPKPVAIKNLQDLLRKFNIANIHNFDVQINGRIKILTKK